MRLLRVDSEWWKTERSDEERRQLPTKLYAAYNTVVAKINALGPNDKLKGWRLQKGSEERQAAELWNSLVTSEGGTVSAYEGPDVLLQLPTELLSHPKIMAVVNEPDIRESMVNGVITAPFQRDFSEALEAVLKAIIEDPSEIKKTRVTAIMVVHWLEDFLDGCE